MRKKRIILPTDFSKNAWNAIAYTLIMFKNVPCDFFVINAYQVGASGLSTKMAGANDTRLYNLMKEQSERDLHRELEKIKSFDLNPDHGFKALSIADTLVNAIGKTVYKEGIDYIILGTKGASGLKEVFMGSNAYKVVKEIDFCPVLVVPDDYRTVGTIQNILLATGYEHLFENYELKPLLNIIEQFNAKLWIAHVGNLDGLTTEQIQSKNTLKKRLKTIDFEFVEVEKDVSINHTVQKLVDSDKAIDMVAMINQDHSFFEKLTREPVIKKVTFNSKVPFLVIHLFE
ncbi:universal stress protein [Flagellimonas crocea]|uniref:universal stress protein n=1 Tax=Flagellimonas crocea TaxID=3067311 RepID=UPI00296E74BB|nr:universal stress protein [Muricauda sp. DH64]